MMLIYFIIIYLHTPYILQPTRLQSKSLIDNIFFNSLEYQSKSGNILIEISDHLIQFLILEGYVKDRILPEINMYKRDFKNLNEREFNEVVINGIDWDRTCSFEKNDPDFSCKNFIDTFNFHLDEFAPYRKVTKKEYTLMLKPWITKVLLQKCKERDSILKSISKEIDPVQKIILRDNYKKNRNDITKEKRESKKAYYTAYFEKNKCKPNEIWKGIRSLVNVKSSKSSTIKLFDTNENLISDSKAVSDIFNNHFATIGSKIEQRIPLQSGNYKDYLNKKDRNNKLIINFDNNLFSLYPTDTVEVGKIIDALDIKKSTGPNGVPVFILKIFKVFFSFWLSKLLNQCFEVGVFPDILKLAKVTPLHKKDSKLDFLNYRPISLLSAFSKVYEKLIYKRIYEYFIKYDFIYNKQFGFRSNYSTNHALISITEHIRERLDLGYYV